MLRAMVAAMRQSTRRALADMRLARRRQTLGIRTRLHRHRAAVLGRVEALLGRTAAAAADPAAESLAERVLEVVTSHPGGIAVQDIGNELGIDWRGVTAATSGLVARGRVDHIDQNFYPSGKRVPDADPESRST